MFTFFSFEWEYNFEWIIWQKWKEEAIVCCEILSSIYTAEKGESQEDYRYIRYPNLDSNLSPPE
jgi:hypothetical protein